MTLKFEQQVVLTGESKATSQIDFDMEVLSATYAYMCQEYAMIFNDLDEMVRIINRRAKKCQKQT